MAGLQCNEAATLTDTRITDTGQGNLFASGAVSGLVDPRMAAQLLRAADPNAADLRLGDVLSANDRSTPTIRTTPGTRTSTTATRTGITSRTSSASSRSAERGDAAFYSPPAGLYRLLYEAWLDFRRGKGGNPGVAAFERDLERNLDELHAALAAGAWTPGRSICFVITCAGKHREVWAATTRDRIVHHLLYRQIAPRFERAFIADSCACIAGRGTLYAARRLEAMARALTRNWSRPGRYLKCDLANFFVSIDKPRLMDQLERKVHEPWWHALTRTILFHDPRLDVEIRGDRTRLALIPAHKSLYRQDADHGLPIGNLPSQFFANVYLDALDQFVKHRLRAPHYVRYVDDFVLLHASAAWLNEANDAIAAFLAERLGVRLNDAKTVRQPIARGIDFIGQVIAPHRRTLRRRTYNAALHRLVELPDELVPETATSYLGLCRQASHSQRDRARLANLARRRGFAVDHALTKVYP